MESSPDEPVDELVDVGPFELPRVLAVVLRYHEEGVPEMRLKIRCEHITALHNPQRRAIRFELCGEMTRIHRVLCESSFGSTCVEVAAEYTRTDGVHVQTRSDFSANREAGQQLLWRTDIVDGEDNDVIESFRWDATKERRSVLAHKTRQRRVVEGKDNQRKGGNIQEGLRGCMPAR